MKSCLLPAKCNGVLAMVDWFTSLDLAIGLGNRLNRNPKNELNLASQQWVKPSKRSGVGLAIADVKTS